MPTLIKATGDQDKDVRRAARKSLGELVRAAPEQAKELLPTLIKAAENENKDVRIAAHESLGQLVKAAPQLAEKLLPTLIKATGDQNENVRRKAHESLVELVKAAASKQAKEFLPTLIKAMLLPISSNPMFEIAQIRQPSYASFVCHST